MLVICGKQFTCEDKPTTTGDTSYHVMRRVLLCSVTSKTKSSSSTLTTGWNGSREKRQEWEWDWRDSRRKYIYQGRTVVSEVGHGTRRNIGQFFWLYLLWLQFFRSDCIFCIRFVDCQIELCGGSCTVQCVCL